jgi:hypothetical protein
MVISNLGANPLVLQVPIGSEDQFKVGTRSMKKVVKRSLKLQTSI